MKKKHSQFVKFVRVFSEIRALQAELFFSMIGTFANFTQSWFLDDNLEPKFSGNYQCCTFPLTNLARLIKMVFIGFILITIFMVCGTHV